MYRGTVLMHWSKMQSNVALSSAEAELNATVKGLSELIGVFNLIRETQKVEPNISLYTDASACKGMLLRHGSGKVKHLSVKQLWSQEVVKFYNIQVYRVERAQNPADLLTHSVSFPVAEKQLKMLNVRRGGGEETPGLGSGRGLMSETARSGSASGLGSGRGLMSETARPGSAHCELGSGRGLMSETAHLGVGRGEEWRRGHSGQRSGGGLMSAAALPRAREAEIGGSQTPLGSLQVRGPASRAHCPKEETQQVRGSKPRSAGPGAPAGGRGRRGLTRPTACAGPRAAARAGRALLRLRALQALGEGGCERDSRGLSYQDIPETTWHCGHRGSSSRGENPHSHGSGVW